MTGVETGLDAAKATMTACWPIHQRPVLAFAYDFQLVDEIDVEPHDVGVDMVITDTRLLYTRKKQR